MMSQTRGPSRLQFLLLILGYPIHDDVVESSIAFLLFIFSFQEQEKAFVKQ